MHFSVPAVNVMKDGCKTNVKTNEEKKAKSTRAWCVAILSFINVD